MSCPDQFMIDEIVEHAKSAQKKWAKTPASARSKILREAARILESKNDEIALIETIDTGRPIRETSVVDIISSVDCLNFIASQVETLATRYQDLGNEQFFFTLNKPIGVCLGIGLGTIQFKSRLGRRHLPWRWAMR